MIEKKIIGTHRLSYLENRTFAMQNEHYQVHKFLDLIKIPSFIYWKLSKDIHPYLNNLFWDLGINKYDLLHFFNAVNIGNQPWITTFEQYIPRGAHAVGAFPKENRYIEFVLKRAANKSCKKLIALSDYAYRSQCRYLKAYGKYEEEVISKMEVLHPPQIALITDYKEKKLDRDFLTFTIVGADFFRKGGKEILNVFDRLLIEKKSVKLNIISSMGFGDYASKTTKEDYIKAMGIIEKHKNIVHYQSKPNNEVLDLLKSTDIGLLPSYDETYGFFVLECQAAGCPVFTTIGGAMTEINTNDLGWLIDVPLEEDGRSVPRSNEGKIKFTKLVEDSLYQNIIMVLNNYYIVKEKGEKCIARINEKHNYPLYFKKMEAIYTNALTN